MANKICSVLQPHSERLSSSDDASSSGSDLHDGAAAPQSISALSTEDWRAQHEADGVVDLWVEEEFNSGSRLMVSARLYSLPF